MNKPQPLRHQKAKTYLILYVSVFLIISSFISGFFIGGWQIGKLTPTEAIDQAINKPDISEDTDFTLFWKVWNNLHDNYVDQPINDTELLYGSIKGMVDSLDDPHSVFLNPTETDSFNQEISGIFEGIGAEISIKNEQLTVIAPLSGTPAQKAGLKSQDYIIGIDGEDTSFMSIDEAVLKIRGPQGTEVVLNVYRESTEEFIDIPITRDTITIKTVQWEMKEQEEKNIAYLEISHFNIDTTEDFKDAAKEILEQNPDGMIVDLRNNPGGYLETAINITSEFLNTETVVIEQFQDQKKEEYRAHGDGTLQDIKIVVLVNEGSASASEILAGALQDHEKATIIGTKTFGKGSVQDYRELSNGASLKLTVAKWLTPLGRSINEEGIEPDIHVELTQEDYQEDRDPQLDEALKQF